MSLLIIFRKREKQNRFHQLIIDSLRTGVGDNALICSGFFQEDAKFSASFSTGLCCTLRDQGIRLKTIGIHNGQWKYRYKKFRDNLRKCGNNITCYLSKGFRWHAKIYILKKGSEPIMGIIGSSNMTRNAFGLTSPFNFEADVVLWDTNNKIINDLCQQQTEIADNLDDIIYADYNIERNRGRTSIDKLRTIEGEILSESLTLLDE